MRVESVLTIEEARRRYSRGLLIDLGAGGPADNLSNLVGRLRRSLEPHRREEAGCAVSVMCQQRRRDGLTARGKVQLGPDWRVNPSDDLLRNLRREFGDEQVSLTYTG